MAGGTGGHVFPGLAVAKYLGEKGVEVHWLGTQAGLESRLVPAENIPLHRINISGLRGKGIKALLAAPFKIIAAIKQSLQVMKEVKPDAVIGMGGFVSGPGGVAAWLSRRPLIIHEQNAKAGLTNKVLAPFAKRVLQGFPGAFKVAAKVMVVGNPVRTEIEHLPPPSNRFAETKHPLHLLVLGGSLGAQALNERLPRALAQLRSEQLKPEQLKPEQLKLEERLEVWHQTGDKNFEATKKMYESLGIEVKLTPFIDDMAEAYAWADMVLCRAGASTVAELCAAGLGAALVPYPYAVDDHQTANAEFMVKNKAALCIQQTELTEERLADIVRQFSQSPEQCLLMAQSAYQLRRVQVAEKFYEVLCDVISGVRLA
jgi:UDP-N-acetylglucosamine--N-acetylmuramyl-(pentapeptide) pyrophosphoryl-undecaprenol N-acetylglucosamine transferase